MRKVFRRDELNELYMTAHGLDEDRFDYEMRVVSMKLNIVEIVDLLKKNEKSNDLIEIGESVLLYYGIENRFFRVCLMMMILIWFVINVVILIDLNGCI